MRFANANPKPCYKRLMANNISLKMEKQMQINTMIFILKNLNLSDFEVEFVEILAKRK